MKKKRRFGVSKMESTFTNCISILTITGRTEFLDRFRNTMDNNEFHFNQTIYPDPWEIKHGRSRFDKKEKWGTEDFVRARVLSNTSTKIVLWCETKETPGLAWAKRCHQSFKRKRAPLTIQTAHYNIATEIYGMHLMKVAGEGKHQWKIGTSAFTPTEEGKKLREYSHFGCFLKQFGFLDVEPTIP